MSLDIKEVDMYSRRDIIDDTIELIKLVTSD